VEDSTEKPDTNLILIPAIESLHGNMRTRKNNTVATTCTTGVVPDYVRVYKEDLTSLDSALREATQSSDDMKSLLWYFASWKFGHQMQLEEGQEMSMESFAIDKMFDKDTIEKASFHDFHSTCTDYSLFWDRPKTKEWTKGELKRIITANEYWFYTAGINPNTYSLYGLWELGSSVVTNPQNTQLEACIGGHSPTFLQMYTLIAKATSGQVPFSQRPHTLTYVLGQEYVSRKKSFQPVWEDVSTRKTLNELLENVHPGVLFEARMEIVLSSEDLNILSEVDYELMAQLIVEAELLVKVRILYTIPWELSNVLPRIFTYMHIYEIVY
jgi:hypothetical protein